MSVIKGYIVPGLPQPLQCPEKNEGWQNLRNAFDQVRSEIEKSEADVILVYSTMWPSILGHQVQANPEPEWIHVDEQFHDLGEIPYKFKIDSELAHEFCNIGKDKGLHIRPINYHGFPIDTGSIVALKLLNPDNRIPSMIMSSNIYSDRAETVVLGKSALEALAKQGKKAVVVLVSTMSNRLHDKFIDDKDDHVQSAKDDEWNRKVLEFLGEGRLEDVSQLSRQIHREARVKKVVNFKSFWWLSSVMGAHNRYTGDVLAYEALYGTGGAVVGLTPAETAARDLEFDEESPEFYTGDRNVLGPSLEASADFSSHNHGSGQGANE